MTVHIYRVVVRGQFADLAGDVADRLRTDAEEHDIFHSAYTALGTFTYDARLESFSFRYEVRVQSDGDDTSSDDRTRRAAEHAETRARETLDGAGIGYKRLRSTVTDMADMWR